ncbi:MAG TPA: dienelactone hydrolase family protein [Acidimicrobiia bacterium]|nr:dienelactone hydrolase family protein [Acidimicrobiia bacterium]
MYDGMLAETITITGHAGDPIPAYLARPLGPGPFPGVVVIHHMPGYDPPTRAIAREFAASGYSAICPNLHHRYAPGESHLDAARATREAGGVPDAQCIGDVAAASALLRTLPNANGKVGVIGYCSGGRQAYVVACNVELDAAVDCYGGNVVMGADKLTPAQPVAPIDMTPDMGCPLLGLFGAEDANPAPDQVAQIDAALREHGKEHEFHTYEGAGHAFFTVDRPNYNVDAAIDGWQKILDFFARHLS